MHTGHYASTAADVQSGPGAHPSTYTEVVLRTDWYGLDHFSNLINSSLVHRLHTYTHPFNGPFLGLPGSASTRKVKPSWILLKLETVGGRGISWAICKSATRSRKITTPAPHHSDFYRPHALPATQPTASKHHPISFRVILLTEMDKTIWVKTLSLLTRWTDGQRDRQQLHLLYLFVKTADVSILFCWTFINFHCFHPRVIPTRKSSHCCFQCVSITY